MADCQKEEKNIIFKTASEHAFTYSLAAIIYKKKPLTYKKISRISHIHKDTCSTFPSAHSLLGKCEEE